MPTPAKKGRKSTSTAPEDQDPMSQMRERFAKGLRPTGRLPTVENVISSIQELLDSNKTVLDRCQQAIHTFENKSIFCKVLLTKPKFEYIRSHHTDGKLLFTTTPEYSEKEFNIEPLIKLPSELDILNPKRIKYGLIDYESLFKMSSVLDDSSDIRISYLIKLKNHLLLIQSCLNDIENWWNEDQTNLSFLESIFGAGVVKEAEAIKTKDPLCENCHCHFSCHQRFSQPTAFGASPYGATTSTSFFCNINQYYNQPVQSGLFAPPSFGPNLLGAQVHQQYSSSSPYHKTFTRSASLPLKSFVTSTKIDDCFNLFDESERARLVKLVTFLSH